MERNYSYTNLTDVAPDGPGQLASVLNAGATFSATLAAHLVRARLAMRRGVRHVPTV
jgi:hypothetical protein